MQVHLSNVNRSVVQRVENAIHRINYFSVVTLKANYSFHWTAIYPVDNVIHSIVGASSLRQILNEDPLLKVGSLHGTDKTSTLTYYIKIHTSLYCTGPPPR